MLQDFTGVGRGQMHYCDLYRSRFICWVMVASIARSRKAVLWSHIGLRTCIMMTLRPEWNAHGYRTTYDIVAAGTSERQTNVGQAKTF